MKIAKLFTNVVLATAVIYISIFAFWAMTAMASAEAGNSYQGDAFTNLVLKIHAPLIRAMTK